MAPGDAGMRQSEMIRKLEAATPEFEKLDWLSEVIVFGAALSEDPVDTDVDVLFITTRTLSGREMQEARQRLQPLLEDRVRQPLGLRITSERALETTRAQEVGYGRHLRERYLSIFRREGPAES